MDDILNTKGCMCAESVYSYTDELTITRGKLICFFVYLNDNLVYIGSGGTELLDELYEGRSNVKEFRQMYSDGTINLLDVFVVKSFLSRDLMQYYEAFCIKRFKPEFNKSAPIIEDKVIVRQTMFLDEHRSVYVAMNDARMKIGLLSELGYPDKLIADVFEVDVKDVVDIKTKSAEHRNILQPFEYYDQQLNVKVDKSLLRHFSNLNNHLVELMDKKYTFEYW